MKHTKGPWHVEWNELDACAEGLWPISDDYQTFVAHVEAWDKELSRATKVTAKANAHLIANAPMMYQALKAIADTKIDEKTNCTQLIALFQAMARIEVSRAEGNEGR